MSPQDFPLWNKFLTEHGAEFKGFDYDVKIGEGVKPLTPVPNYLEKDLADLTKKRIDAVGYQSDGVQLFEVKPRAGTAALGQLLGYKVLYNSTFPNNKVKALVLVTSYLNQDEIQYYNSYNITIYTY